MLLSAALGGDLSLNDCVLHSVHCTENSCSSMPFKLRAAKVGLHETFQSVVTISRDQQRPVKASVSASNTLFACHLRRHSPLKQMDAADPGS